jgi:hypothetical protein
MDVILHIGKQKTGSTAIQHRLRRLRRQLARQGVVYSTAFGEPKASALPEAFQTAGSLDQDKQNEEMLAAFAAELRSDARTLIVSNENMFNMSRASIGRLQQMIAEAGATARVYVFLRRIADDLPSLYQQRVRTGGLTLSLEEFLQEMQDHRYYRYKVRLDDWAEAFGRDAMHVRLFHRETIGTDLFEDFMAWIGIKPPKADFDDLPVRSTNESYDSTAIAILLALRRLQAVDTPGVDRDLVIAFRRKLILSRGQRPGLTLEQAADLMATFRGDNEAAATAYLTPREAEILLEPQQESTATPPVEPYQLVVRSLDVLPDLHTWMGKPAAPDGPRAEPANPAAAGLLRHLDRFQGEHPDRLTRQTIAAAAQKLAAQPAGETAGLDSDAALVGQLIGLRGERVKNPEKPRIPRLSNPDKPGKPRLFRLLRKVRRLFGGKR